MEGRSFESLELLVAAVVDNSNLTAFAGKYRGKDFYILAESEDAAFAVVAKGLGVEVGYVPLDLIIRAARNSTKPAAGRIESPPVDLDKMKMPELVALAAGHGIEIDPKGKKADAVKLLREKVAAYRAPQEGQADFNFGANAAKPESDAPAK